MKKEVFEYFENLENSDLPKYKNTNILSCNTSKLKRIESEDCSVIKYKKGKNTFYAKPWNDGISIHGIASSNMYNDLGILNPPSFLIKKQCSDKPYVISQNVRDLKQHGFNCTLAEFTPISKVTDKIPSFYDRYNKWELLYNKDLREYFLTFMTEDCLNDFMAKYLADELRSDGDGHLGNFFLYKKRNKDGKVGRKYDGIIPIDLELSEVLSYCNFLKLDKMSKKQFDSFLDCGKQSFTPLGVWLNSTYKEDIDLLRELISKGLLREEDLDLIKRELQYDFPKEIKKVGKKYNIKKDTQIAYDTTSRLWDYNIGTVGKDVGI